ncbi:fibronectin-III type domain-containing protein windei isoform X2 [Temnothorax americanus]|uniref:fibronectin-III type domain-containing protein windei isoform X2 n=1 Tax=Temnothorax americanus TaxID=1964332 RepID=UPI0040678F07
MEKTQAGTVHNSESSSPVTCDDRTDNDELSKEKEDELLFGVEDDGDDEDALSDDSLRLRLSDDDEQENTTTNDTNTAELKSQSRIAEQPILDKIAEKTLCSDLRETVKEVSKSDSEESAQNEHDTAPLDEYTSENKQVQDNIRKSENTSATANEFNEKCTFKSSKDLKITDVTNACPSAVLKGHIAIENDKLSINNHTHTSNVRNAELTTHSEENLKEASSDSNKIISTNCELNNVDSVDSNIPSVDSANIKICKSEKLITNVIVSNNNDDNLEDKIVDKRIKNNSHSLKSSHVELNNGPDYVDLVTSGNSKDSLSYIDTIAHKNKNKNSEPMDVTESKSASNISNVTEKVTNISLIQDQNISSNVKDNAEVTEDRNVDKFVTQTIDNNLLLTNILLVPSDVDNSNSENGTKNVDTVIPRNKRIKKTINTVQDRTEEDKQEEQESGRQKRKTAKNAEEIIRKKYLNSDSDSSDNTEVFVPMNHKLNPDIRPASPPSLKRNCPENEVFNEKFFRRDLKEKLPKLTQEELEELLIQKIAETIAMRSEIGQLREQARISEKYQETTRVKMQQLMKQVKDFEMVLNRNAIDRRANPDKSVAPIKINRSVGLQVSFITEHGMQNLRQTANLKPAANTTNTTTSTTSPPTEANNNVTSPRRGGIKIRSPRPVVTVSTPIITQNHPAQTASVISTVTPAALVVAKPLEASHTLTLSNQPSGIQPILPAPQQTIVLNGKIQNQGNRPIAPKPRNNDLIDLTDEEEKNKSNAKVKTTAPIIEQHVNITPKPAQSFQRVIQTLPANVAITTQPTSIKVITTNQQPVSTALVNNVNPPRLQAYVMQSSGTGSPRQVLIASNANQQVQIRPVSTPNRPPFSTVTYKGVSTLANGTVRLLTTPAVLQINKHPAPLPDIPTYATTPGWKLPPPAPSLKISKVSNGIVLSWNMNLTDKYAEIASYQLYAYQEVAGVSPSTSLWKKVGDVRALPLPMACTLTQFSEGNNYYFAVRAVDTHSRKGQYSTPGNIFL